MTPTQPNFIPMPFAQNGNKNSIPTNGSEGEPDASFNTGFPQITETPLSIGGIPPQRKDFNGILNILSMFAFFGQSGGKFSWSNKLNYNVPCIVYHDGLLWWCLKANGVDDTVVEPGTNATYWISLIEYLKLNADKVGLRLGGGVPIGSIIIWGYAKDPPEDAGTWIDCDGRNVSNYPKLVAAIGSSTVPDYRGLFLRCTGSQTIDKVAHSSPAVGTKQGDAIRNITGTFLVDDMMLGHHGAPKPTGAFVESTRFDYDARSSMYCGEDGGMLKFDASRVVPTATENRPANATVRFLIKADE